MLKLAQNEDTQRIYAFLLMGALVYPPWHYLCLALFPQFQDTFGPRILISVSSLIIILAHKKWQFSQKWLWRLYFILASSLYIHNHQLSVINGGHEFFTLSFFVIITCAIMGMPNYRYYYSYAATSLISLMIMHFLYPEIALRYDVNFALAATFFIINGIGFKSQIDSQERLRRQNSSLILYSCSFESLNDCCIWIDTEGKIIHSNRSFHALFNPNNKEIHVKDIDPGLTVEQWKNIFGRLREKGSLNTERILQSADGCNIVMTINANYINYDGKEYNCAILRDVTKQREVEASLELQKSTMVQSSKMSALGEMASGVAHEINNPLAIIGGSASILKKELRRGDPNLKLISERLDIIEKTTFRIADIIKGLRSFARNSESDPFEEHNIHNIIAETLQFCLERFKKHDVQVRYDIENNSVIKCRSTQISQILLNLLNNAFDAVKNLPDKWVEIHVHEKEDFIEIQVVDSGHGISQAVVDKMMQPFFTTKPVGEGTGLGLSISKGIAEEHRGALTYDKAAQNTTFILKLPKAA